MKQQKRVSSFRGRVQASAKKQQKGGSGSGYLVLPNGVERLVFEDTVKKVQMDFMPYPISDPKHPDRDLGLEVGDLWHRRPFKLHRSIGAGNKSYICLSSVGKRCPICEFQKELFQTDKAAAVKLYAQDRELYAPIPLNSKKHDVVPHVWDMSTKMFNTELEVELADDPDMEIFPDLVEGKTLELKIKWETIGKGRPFPEVSNIVFLDREETYDESILDSVPDLDAIINNSVLSYEELKNAFFETEEEDAGELEEEEDKPRSKKSAPAAKRKPVEEEDDDEEDEKPKKKATPAATSKKPAVVEEDDDEEEEEEKPAKKSVRTTPAAKPASKKPVVEEDDDEDEEEDEIIPKKDRCVACNGTKKNSKGKPCPICKGTGRKPVDEDEDDEDVPPVKKKGVATPTTTSPSKNTCPHGYVFGKDSEKYDACDTCKVWDACADAKEKLGKK
jgi:hypothetical protein